MDRPKQGEFNPWYNRYIDLVPGGEYLTLLRENSGNTIKFFENFPVVKHDFRYAEDKWSIKEILQHLIDTERVMVYRALVAARGDKTTILHNYDENHYAANADVSDRSMSDLLDEFRSLRSSTEKFFENINTQQSELKAKMLTEAVHHPITARAIGYIIIGHINHHINTIKERYLAG
jgi:DinB superfamily